MKLRKHKTLDITNLKRIARAELHILAEGLTKARRAIYGKHADVIDAHSVSRAEHALPWVAKTSNRSPKRMARLKHSLTVLTLRHA